jgi:hypothetical protein
MVSPQAREILGPALGPEQFKDGKSFRVRA